LHCILQSISIPREFFPQYTDRFSENGVRYVDANYAAPRQREDPGAEPTGVQGSNIDAGVERRVRDAKVMWIG
jgi:hypothetical protein